jgi:uroporphyrinogen-III synthase
MFIAAEEHLSDQVLNALSKDVVVASIGPIMTETLIEHGLEPDIVPESPKMGALVYAAAEQAPGLVQTKRAAS